MDGIHNNTLGIFIASLHLLNAQDYMESQDNSYNISGNILNAVFTVIFTIKYDYKNDVSGHILRYIFLFIFLHIIFSSMEDEIIRKFRISKKKAKKIRKFTKIVPAVAWSVTGYYMMNKIFMMPSTCKTSHNH